MALDDNANASLWDEIEYRIDIDDEENREPDYYQALLDAEEIAEYYNDRPMLNAARKTLISLGVYSAMSQHEIENTFTSGGKNYAFKMYKKKYKFREHLK